MNFKMKKIYSKEIQDINGLIKTSNNLKNNLIIEESKTNENNKNNLKNETNDKTPITSPSIDKKIQTFIPSYIPINTLSDSNNFNLTSNNALITSNEIRSGKKENSKINADEILENGLNFDEQNKVNYNKKIENKLNIIKQEQKNDDNKNKDIKNIKSSNDEKKYMNEINQNNKNELLINDTQVQNKLPFGIQIPKDLYDKIEFAIDENGNPFSIKQIDNNSSTIKKPVALIIQKGNKADNYLIDLQGNKISKMEDGYFNYKHNNTRVIIKDFDVQHPELRVYGTTNKDTLITLNDEDINKSKELNNTNNDNKKFEVILNKKIVNLKRNSPIKLKNNKFSKESKTDRRIIYDLNKNKNILPNKKIIPMSYTSNFPTKRISNNYTINRTNNILNKSSSSNISHNRSYTLSNSCTNLLKKRYDSNNNTQRYNMDKINIPPIKEIKNISCTSSRINLYNYKKSIKKGGSFNNLSKAFNLKNINIIHRNVQSFTSLPSNNYEDEIKINNYNSIYCNKQRINNNDLGHNNNITKSHSSNNISSTINNISNKIKYLQNKINNKHANKTFSIPTTSTISTNNSQINNLSKDYNTFNSLTNRHQINNNSSLYKRQFKCAILSKEVNDIISDYSTENNKKTIINLPFKSDYSYMNEIKSNENRINSFLSGHQKITNKLLARKNNYRTESDYIEANNLNNKMNETNIKLDNCGLCGKSILLNRIKSKINSNNAMNNGIINFRRRKINLLANMENKTSNVYSRPIISENYMYNINLMNFKNRMNNKSKFNFLNSRNSLLKNEDNKSQTSFDDFFRTNKNNNSNYNFNYSVSNINDNRDFDFS